MSDDLFKNGVGSCVYKKGFVAESLPGFARVRFDDLDGLLTDWLPTTHANTQNNKDVEALDIGAQVSCLLDARIEDGCILGAHYSNADAPPVASNDKWHKRFKDGTTLEYDRAAHALVVSVRGTLTAIVDDAATIQAASVTLDTPSTTCTGNLTVNGLAAIKGGMTGSGGASFSGGAVTHNGVNIGASHVHGGIYPGGSSTDGPR